MAANTKKRDLESIAWTESPSFATDGPCIRFGRNRRVWIQQHKIQQGIQAMYTQSYKKLSTANKKHCVPSLTQPLNRVGLPRRKNMTDKDKEQQMLRFEIENCRRNIEFYRLQIDQIEDKLSELEKLQEAHEYY